ncbi:MAG TPA: hypothetical protein VMW64_00775 [Dehalococcoidia bacterium]|nr:hypothetical protein [Dehalococcoidia bacterium]
MADVGIVMALNNTSATWRTPEQLNPVTRKQIKLYNQTYVLGKPLDDDELALFKSQFVTLLAAPGSEERTLMLDRLEAYIVTLRAVKEELGGKKFKGLNPEDTELGFGYIRPVFTQVAGAVKVTWAQPFTVAWADWFSSAPGIGYLIGLSFGFCATHLKSLLTPTPVLAECQFTISRTGVLIPFDVRSLRVGDTVNGIPIVPMPTLMLLPRDVFYGGGRSDTVAAVTDEVQLGGLVFGLGRAIRATTVYPTT